MRDLELLLRTLEDQAGAAPDGTGFVEAARTRAARIRTRRRVFAAAAMVTLAVGAAIVPDAISRLLPTGSPPATSPTPRGPFQLTVDVAANSGYRAVAYGVVGSRQHFTLMRSSADSREWGTRVVVHDPGTFDATPFQRGEKVTVRGHPAYYLPDLLVGVVVGTVLPPIEPTRREEMRRPAIGWPEPSGAWVIVYLDMPTTSVSGAAVPGASEKAQLLRVADIVRIGTPRDLQAPFRLGYIPPGLAGRAARVLDYRPGDGLTVSVDLGPHPSAIDMYAGAEGQSDQPLRVYMRPLGTFDDDVIRTLGPPEARIAGYDTWYNTEGTPGWQVAPGTGHVMAIVGRCWLEVSSSDVTQIPYEELKRVVEGARFADCTQPGTWLPPLP